MTTERMRLPEHHLQFHLFTTGDEEALRYVYHHLYPSLLRYAERITGCRFEAATIVQEAVLKAWNSRENMESMQHLYCFMRLVIRWGCFAYLRSPHCRFRRHNLRSIDEDYAEALLLEAWTYISRQDDEDARREQLEARLQQLMEDLPEQKQTILRLWSKENRRITDIARRFRQPNSYVINELKATFQYLKNALDGRKTVPQQRRLCSEGLPSLSQQSREMLRLRLEKGWSFNELALHFNLPVAELVHRYLAAREQLETVETGTV